jgi:alkanesulfonate monooxygenase SsuD/methylene tetrahydromethanopterin reductase-like flavin-dependent oxidoreductase (luciferase family)
MKIEVMKEAASAAGRNPADITVSVMGPAMLAPDEARLSELLNRAAAFRNITAKELEERWTTARIPYGTPEKVEEAFAAFAAVGVTKYYLQWFDLPDRATVEEQVELAAGLKL